MTQKFIIIQDENCEEFTDLLNKYLGEGWKVVPGTLDIKNISVPIDDAEEFHLYIVRETFVMGYAVIEK